MPKGFYLKILMIKNSKKASNIKIPSEDNYVSSINKDDLDNEKNIKKYVNDNKDTLFVVLNPKVFFDKNRKDNNNNNIIQDKEKEKSILAKNIKLGKLI